MALALLIAGGLGAWMFHVLKPWEEIKAPLKQIVSEHSPKKVEAPFGWTWFDTGHGFTFYAPSGSTYHELKGIDWRAGELDAPDFTFRFYLGFHPEPLHQDGDPKYVEQPFEVDYRKGTIQRTVLQPSQIKNRMGYYSRLLLPSAIYHYDYPGTWEALDLYGAASSSQTQADMERVWKTIRFEERTVKNIEY